MKLKEEEEEEDSGGTPVAFGGRQDRLSAGAVPRLEIAFLPSISVGGWEP